ncbi:pyridoxal phosphate-dependent decarboxylase family protein [Bacillus cereus]|uniref:pyridoxal phosphate-dependent decarboxylase family protein n=1 Tax=Bacillus cereus TaxID=1396 RepID=UPI001CFE0E4A
MTNSIKNLGDWNPAQFEEHGIELLGMIREHFEKIREIPVTSNISPNDLLAMLDQPLPEHSQSFEVIMNDTWEKIIPHLTHWNHPSFHGYFSTSASSPGILADLLISSLNVNALVWKAAPAASALEKVILKWIAEMVGYTPAAEGVLLNGASLATFYALVAARDQSTEIDIRTKGLIESRVSKMRIYTSDQAHSSVDKAAIALGIGTDNVVHISTNGKYQMMEDQLEKAIQDDLNNGYCPIAVVATAGTTATGAIDPILKISQICKKYNIWLHVDAAYGGFWNLVPDVKENTEDFCVADSLVVNPHKCLYTPLEVTTLFCKRRGALSNSFRLVPDYLQTEREDGSVDYMDYSLQLGRSFRALKIWWIIRSFGKDGLSKRLEESIRQARWLESEINKHPEFECTASSPYALICLRYFPYELKERLKDANEQQKIILQKYIDELNQLLLTRLNQSKKTFVSHATIKDGYVIRISIGNIHTTAEDIENLWNLIQEVAKDVKKKIPAPDKWLAEISK